MEKQTFIPDKEDDNKKGERINLSFKKSRWKNYFSKTLKPHIRGKVLEVGAGTGSTTACLFKPEIETWHAIEPSKVLYDLYLKNIEEKLIPNKCKIFNCYLSNFQASEKYDTILYIDVLEHIENDYQELETAAKNLNSGGKLIILCPAYNFAYSPFDKAIGHYRRYNIKSLVKAVPKNMYINKSFYLDTIGIFLNLLNKFILKKKDISPMNYQIFNMIISVSYVSDFIFNYKFGRSVIVIAKKL
tara:strand:+ start:493 stop:1224 length:732 start_codon:yes stop_codon:yes gene_type:complete